MDLLPRTVGAAAENMARDLLLLEAYPRSEVSRLRLYGWSEPAHTFGISQRWAEWRPRVPATSALVRRPTGGGLVSHLEDWTYALAVPSGHPVFALEAILSYEVALGALAEALRRQGMDVAQVPRPSGPRGYQAPTVCGQRPEPHDLVAGREGRKVAGAAQKRTRGGLLLQGYVDRAVLPGCDWLRLERDFPETLAKALGTSPHPVETPALDGAALAAETARFASAGWNERT
ncbi:MAG: lipoyl protein ligase domain-containing protein [Opitutia bacterium]|jgi:lipoate-protein ligase A